MLDTESLGHVSEFKAVPGYGIECAVSGTESMLQSVNSASFLTATPQPARKSEGGAENAHWDQIEISKALRKSSHHSTTQLPQSVTAEGDLHAGIELH